MKQRIRLLKTFAKIYFTLLGIAILLILASGLLTNRPTLGPIVAVFGFGAALAANVFAIFVIPITALTLKEKR